jgi:hypothetical protein
VYDFPSAEAVGAEKAGAVEPCSPGAKFSTYPVAVTSKFEINSGEAPTRIFLALPAI